MAKKVKKKASTKKAAKKTVKKKAAKKAVSKKAATKTKKKSTKSSKAKTAKKKTAKTIKASAKKVSSKKTVTKKRRRKRPRSVLASKDLAHFRDLLLEKLKEILGSVNHIETEALKTSRLDSTGDLSSMPIHMADLGSDNYEQEFALGLMDSERKIVQEIHEALKRIQNKTYGICEGTGEPIPKMRLEGIPWTRYCVQYAEMLEKGLVEEPEQDNFDDIEYEEGEDLESLLDEDQEDLEEDDERDPFSFPFADDDDDDDEDEEL